MFCHDISDACTPLPIQNESVDLVLMVFVLSAIPRKLMEVAIEKALKVTTRGHVLPVDLEAWWSNFRQGLWTIRFGAAADAIGKLDSGTSIQTRRQYSYVLFYHR